MKNLFLLATLTLMLFYACKTDKHETPTVLESTHVYKHEVIKVPAGLSREEGTKYKIAKLNEQYTLWKASRGLNSLTDEDFIVAKCTNESLAMVIMGQQIQMKEPNWGFWPVQMKDSAYIITTDERDSCDMDTFSFVHAFPNTVWLGALGED